MVNDLTPVDAELASLRNQMADPGGDYWRNDTLQTRYRELITAKENGTAVAPISKDAQELANIKKMMGNHDSAYWKGADAERLQARYRELTSKNLPAQTDEAPDQGGRLVDFLSFTEYQAQHKDAGEPMGDYGAYMKTVRGAVDVMASIPAEMRSGFIHQFDLLPEDAQVVLLDELTVNAPSTSLATQGALQNFSTTPEGASLVREWGGEATRRLGLLKARFERILNRLTEADEESVLTWFNELSSPHAKAVMRRLAQP